MKTIDPTEQDEDNKNVPLFLVKIAITRRKRRDTY